MKRIAITGGIGSGKSTVVKLFNELGTPSLDADQVARQVRDLPSVNADIKKRFGTADRLELRQILSSDPEAKADLEKLLHPLIKTMSESKLKKIESSSNAPFLLYEASLIIEAGRAKEFDGLIVVTAPVDQKIARIIARDQISKEAAEAMIKSQMSDEDRLKFATLVIENSGDLEQLKLAVQKNASSMI